MKSKLLINKVLEKVPVSNRQELIDKMNAMQDFDIPDEFEAVISGLQALHTEESARASKPVADHVTRKYEESITKQNHSEYKAAGLEDAEIDQILSYPFASRWQVANKILLEKERKKFNMNESERVRLAEERAAEMKERADRLQATYVEKEKNDKRSRENEMMQFRLREYISQKNFNDNIPKKSAIKLVMENLENKLRARNASIILSEDNLKLAPADDPSMNYYDEKNTLVTIDMLIEQVMQEEKVFRSKEVPKTNPGINAFNRNNVQTANVAGQGTQRIPVSATHFSNLTQMLLTGNK